MDPWRQGNMGFVPHQGQPNTLSTLSQPRRPLAINDMLNHGPTPPRHRDARPPPGYPSLLPPPPMHAPAPQPHHPYLPGPSHPPNPEFIARHRLELPPPLPTGATELRWGGDYYMSHPPGLVPYVRNPPPTDPAPAGLFRTPLVMPNPAAKSRNFILTRKTCVICLEKFNIADPKSHFPHQCKRCASGDFCADCLKDWFLDACKNESKMPPKCCSIIPLSAVAKLLDSSQIELYKAKYEEWATPDRIYCPVPTCSAFIPQRLYIKIRQGSSAPRNAHIIPGTFNQSQISQQASPKKDIKPHVACPTCGVSVCTNCRSLSHIGNCPKKDIDPVLEEQLKKWKIKRCPKCRTGVRRMYGCSHIECRCGAHFCWECLLPIGQCGGQCDEEGSDADPNEYRVEEDDLDGHAGFYEGAGPDFGPEPYGHVIDAWGCQHLWSLVAPITPSTLGRRPMECNRCFRTVQPLAKDEAPVTVDEDIEMTGMTLPWPTNIFGEPAWQCFTGHIVCWRCPKLSPSHRQGDASWMWICDCGISCSACDKVEAMTKHANDEKFAKEQKEKEDSLAWECRCGTILCGACKGVSEHL